MANVYSREHPGGFTMALGLNVRPRDAAEDAYHFARMVAPRAGTADLSQPRTLSRYPANASVQLDLRPEIENQGNLGACASYSAVASSRIAARAVGRFSITPPMLTGDRLYEMARKAEGTFPNDGGSTLATPLDLLLNKGDTLESADPEHGNAAFDYGDLNADESAQEWIASHHPFYPSEGQTLENLWLALDQGQPVQIGTFWAQSWFNPDARGVIDPSATPAQAEGGHAIYAYAWWPRSYAPWLPSNEPGLVALANQWSPGWCTQITASGIPDVRPGEFIIPASVFLRGVQSVIFECRSVAAKVYTPPQPGPSFQPNPQVLACFDGEIGNITWTRGQYVAGNVATAAAQQRTDSAYLNQLAVYLASVAAGGDQVAALPVPVPPTLPGGGQ